jgi:hypothetical protein
MQTVKRTGIFETNSSSCHSISVVGGKYTPSKFPCSPDGRVCEVYPGEFGWGPEEYRDAVMKASYCLTYAKERPDEGTGYLLERLERVLKDMTGARYIEFLSVGGYYPWGYIDHQSSHVCGEVFTSDQDLKDFIFNPASVLIIDNDNH